MSLLSLLIASSIVAAVAFFLAGLLLRSPRGQQPADTGPSADEGLVREREREIERLRDRQTFVESALEEARAACKSEAGARIREEERRSLAEGELDKARSEAERLSANERTLADRLRNAEDQNRAHVDREETNAEGWKTQLDAAQAEQKRQIRTVREEVDRLGVEIARQKAERIRLVEERDRHATRANETERALADLRARSIEESQQHDRVREGLEGAVRAAEERERGALRRLAEAEAAHEGKSEAVRESSQTLQALQAAIQGERLQWAERIQRAEVACQAELDEKRGLGVRLRALEASVEYEREQGRFAAEALRGAEARLADLDRLARENSELRAQQAEVVREAKWQVGRDDPARDVKVELAAAQAKLTELEGALEENRKLRDEAAELRLHQEATGELERLASAHKQLRLDAELMARRLQELLQDRAELVSLRAQAAEAASLVEEVAYLRRREKDLEARLYASGLGASREIAVASGEPPAQTPVSDMKTNLHSLVGDGGPRTAVLADAQGFLIASDGESAVQESLAAFTAVAGEMVARARMLLPLAEVESVRVTDKNHTVLTCHLFDSAGEGLGIATLGPGEPSARGTAQAIVGLAAIVGGAEPATDDEPEPATG